MNLTRDCNYVATPQSLIAVDLTVHKGAAYDIDFTILQPNTTTPATLTTETFSFYLRRITIATNTFEIFSTSSPTINGSTLTITNPATGKVRLHLTDEETNLWTTGEYEWWLGIGIGADIYKQVSGTITLKEPFYV